MVPGFFALVLVGELALKIDAQPACAEERAEHSDDSGGREHSASSLGPNGLARAQALSAGVLPKHPQSGRHSEESYSRKASAPPLREGASVVNEGIDPSFARPEF